MPEHAKHTKYDRDTGMISGMRKQASKLSELNVGRGLTTVDAVIARYQAHLDAMADVSQKEIAWRLAVERERGLEAEIKALHPRVQSLLRSTYGDRSGELRQFGLKPGKKAQVAVAVKASAVEKRRETRKARRTMGKKQRKQIKGKA